MNIQEITNFEEMLLIGVAYNSVDLVKIALEKGVDVDAKAKWQETPLHKAARNNFLEVAKLLLEKGANVNARDVDKYTPLPAPIAKKMCPCCKQEREEL